MTTRFEYDATRRGLLRAGLAAIGGVAAIGSAQAELKIAQEKIAQAQVQYQTTPKDAQKCSICVNFEAPSSCKIVAGTIAPEGWCIAFAPKES